MSNENKMNFTKKIIIEELVESISLCFFFPVVAEHQGIHLFFSPVISRFTIISLTETPIFAEVFMSFIEVSNNRFFEFAASPSGVPDQNNDGFHKCLLVCFFFPRVAHLSTAFPTRRHGF